MRERGPLFAILGMALLVALPLALLAAPKASGPTGKTVDSGSFGIFVNGRRVATESFQIQQGKEKSVATSELKVEDGTNKAAQTMQLELAANGDLLHYEWKSLQPEKSEMSVDPSNEFLTEHIVPGDNEKPLDVPFILPHSTMILDDYSFMQREILLWRYLAISCNAGPGDKGCNLPKQDFGVLVPRQHISLQVSLEYKGREKVMVRGKEMQLDHFDLKYEDGRIWALFIDQSFRLIRVAIDADKTEVVRD